ncbi:TPA: DUF1372 family protein [Streptococcus pyogenes]|uniref:Phage protein n=3 Tax=Streptococcus TaxID=1301 RepID=A0A9X8T1Y1_STREQ|nr:phage protein [Streptococcus dysgalactiae subsp. equisimilis]VTS20405.1 phage protein [Streptococcus anginosus]HEQ9463602.1 DUF1372 family protein [Streptococcus pyogenes]HEQ9486034.1 DUF1372 family protein [Streptococcus pyogenes]HEQ9524364.1 DUF1372 family protein [Streptococcus pyogenes]
MDELKEYSPLLALICMFFFAGGVATATLFDDETPQQQPIIIHTVDNAGGMMAGQITDKEIIEGRYTVTAGAYGKFLVTKEQYESLKVGDDIPDYLKKRGTASNDKP